jgi:hypothetical protein
MEPLAVVGYIFAGRGGPLDGSTTAAKKMTTTVHCLYTEEDLCPRHYVKRQSEYRPRFWKLASRNQRQMSASTNSVRKRERFRTSHHLPLPCTRRIWLKRRPVSAVRFLTCCDWKLDRELTMAGGGLICVAALPGFTTGNNGLKNLLRGLLGAKLRFGEHLKATTRGVAGVTSPLH